MWLQYLVSIYQREGNCVVDKTHTSFWQVVLNGADLFSYEGHAKQPLPFPFGVVFIFSRTSVNVVDDNSGSCCSCEGLDD